MTPVHWRLHDASQPDGAGEILAVMFALLCGFLFCGTVLLRRLKTATPPTKQKTVTKTGSTNSVVERLPRSHNKNQVEGITLLPHELQAKVFGYTGMDGLLNFSTASANLHTKCWDNSVLWQHSLCDAGIPMAPQHASHDASALRDHYRVKSLGIDNDDAPWRSGDTSAAESQEMMLKQATRVCGGLQPSDGADQIAACLASSLNLLRIYDVRSAPAREQAKRLVDVIRRRGTWQYGSLFDLHEVDDAVNALTESLELHDMLNAGEAVLYAEQDVELSSTEPPEQQGSTTDPCELNDKDMDRLIDSLKEILANTKNCPMDTPSVESRQVFSSPSYEEVLGSTCADLLVAGI